MTYQPIEKSIEPSLDVILDLMNPASYEVKLSGHYLDGRVFELTKGDRQYDFKSSSTILKGVQTHQEIQFEGSVIVEFSKPDINLFAQGKHILINSISYNDEFSEKLFSGSIASLSTSQSATEFDDKFLRLIIPVGTNEPFNIGQFQRRYFTTPHKKSPLFITVNVSNEEFHLFSYKLGDDFYLVIDCTAQIELKAFQQKCFNLLLALGFIKGNLIHDECFIVSYGDSKMQVPENVLYHSMRASVSTNQAVFTSNPFSVHSDIDFPRDENGHILKELQDKLYDGIIDFPEEVFSNLATLLFEQEKVQRAALLYIQGHASSLEMRIPNYYVAIEAITGYISSELITGNKSLSPIKDKTIAGELIKQITELSKSCKSENKLDDNEFDFKIFEKNINKLNAPPNADKLSQSFDYLNYALSSEEKKLLKERNRFLHGSFLKTIDDDKAFRDALHCSLRLHFMIAVLVLKLTGYTGKIINYAELWSHITERTLNEERLVKI
jgi:hypothetical protein